MKEVIIDGIAYVPKEDKKEEPQYIEGAYYNCWLDDKQKEPFIRKYKEGYIWHGDNCLTLRHYYKIELLETGWIKHDGSEGRPENTKGRLCLALDTDTDYIPLKKTSLFNWSDVVAYKIIEEYKA